MAQQTINLGTPPAGSDGDTTRSAFTKCQANFTELYTGAVTLTGVKTLASGVKLKSSPALTIEEAGARIDGGVGTPGQIDISYLCGASDSASVRLFRNTNTTGPAILSVLAGDLTTASGAVLHGKGANSYVCGIDGNFGVGTISPSLAKMQVNGHYAPHADNSFSSGIASRRHSVVYAGTGAISTSDARQKTPVRSLTLGEIDAAVEVYGAIGGYKWLACVADKGDAARTHIGVTVQSTMEIMERHGLDPFAYGFICYDSWPEHVEPAEYVDVEVAPSVVETAVLRDAVIGTFNVPELLDDQGRVLREAKTVQVEIEPAITSTIEVSPAVMERRCIREEVVHPAGDVYSLRTDELLLWVSAALAQSHAALAGRVAALESMVGAGEQ